MSKCPFTLHCDDYASGRTPQTQERKLASLPLFECVRSGRVVGRHSSSISEGKLPYFGLEPEASLVTLSKRLVCKECGSKAVQTFRYSEDTAGPPLVPEN